MIVIPHNTLETRNILQERKEENINKVRLFARVFPTLISAPSDYTHFVLVWNL